VLNRRSLFSVILLCAASAVALAQASGDVQATLRVSRVVVLADGTESHQSAEAAKPGDVLEYIAEYHNSSSHSVRQLAATLPIPDGTEYIADSALPGGVLASVDGTTFSAIPLKRRVVQPDGKVLEQPIPYREYRFLRWPAQGLGAGKTFQVGARARLSADKTAAVGRLH
jgi:uncharacterized repeat protein (TIGR01451 family)